MWAYFFFYFIKICFPFHFLFKWRQNLSARPRTWPILSIGIRNFNLRTMSSQEEGEDCFEPIINIHRHPLSSTSTPIFLFSLFKLKQKGKLFLCRTKYRGAFASVFLLHQVTSIGYSLHSYGVTRICQ